MSQRGQTHTDMTTDVRLNIDIYIRIIINKIIIMLVLLPRSIRLVHQMVHCVWRVSRSPRLI